MTHITSISPRKMVNFTQQPHALCLVPGVGCPRIQIARAAATPATFPGSNMESTCRFWAIRYCFGMVLCQDNADGLGWDVIYRYL